MNSYTVNVRGDWVQIAKLRGHHAYYADDVTAIEIKAKDKKAARLLIRAWGCEVLFVFE